MTHPSNRELVSMTPGRSRASRMYFAMVPLPEPGAPARKMISLGNTMFSKPGTRTVANGALGDSRAPTHARTESIDEVPPRVLEYDLGVERVRLGIGEGRGVQPQLLLQHALGNRRAAGLRRWHDVLFQQLFLRGVHHHLGQRRPGPVAVPLLVIRTVTAGSRIRCPVPLTQPSHGSDVRERGCRAAQHRRRQPGGEDSAQRGGHL